MSQIAHPPNPPNPPTPQPATDQPIHLRARPDLVIAESEFEREKCWIVKDPISLKYYRLGEPEYLVLQMLNGQSTLSKIIQALSRLLGGVPVDTNHVKGLINSLHQRELLVARLINEGPRLLAKREKINRLKRIARSTNLLSIRFPGVDPERFLAWLYAKLFWIFHPLAVAVSGLLILAAGLLMTQNSGEVAARLPEMRQFFGAQNLLAMGLLLIVTKSLHEIGHGLACKHFGGECHEIGFMLLVFMPVMYCNTSDSWMVKNKWSRIAIGAAGMYVEIVLASLCTFVWWNTHPGWLHYACLNIMFISGVSTVIFNANPLLRYDGYYIMSDFLEIPNLTQKSRAALLGKLRTLCLGLPPVPSRFMPQRRTVAFALYSIASFCYRWFVLFVILLLLLRIFKPFGLQLLGHALIGLSLTTLIVLPIYKLSKFFADPRVRSQVKLPRLIASSIVAAALVAAVCLIPIPQNVYAPFEIRPVASRTVYVSSPGLLRRCKVQPGDWVAEGELLATLQDLQLNSEIIKLEGNVRALRREYALLEQLASGDLQLVTRFTDKYEELVAATNQLNEARQIEASLQLKAPHSGRVLPPETIKPPAADPPSLPTWAGSPLDSKNLGAYLERQTPFCRIAGNDQFEAVLEIDQKNMDLVQVGDRVQLVLDEYPSIRLTSQLTRIASDAIPQHSPELMRAGLQDRSNRGTTRGQPIPRTTSYAALASLDQTELQLLTGFQGTAKIHTGSNPLGEQLVRYFRSIFNFR